MGWRHLRFLLLYSPSWLFLIPGLLLCAMGLILSVMITIKPLQINALTLDVHTLLYSMSSIIIGFQFILFYGLTKIFSVENGLLPKSNRYKRLFKVLNLEKGLIIGGFLVILGFFLSLKSVGIWSQNDFMETNPSKLLRVVIPAITCLQMGVQVILFSLFFSVLGLKNKG